MASVQSRLIAFLLRRFNVLGGTATDIARLRRRTDRMAAWLPAPRQVSVEQIEADGVPAEWLVPPGVPDDRALLYLHGGAWVIGSARMYRSFLSKLALLSQTKALVIDYRLAPEHPFPAALEDCLTAFHYLMDSGIPAQKIVVAGDSAGGNLTLALLVALRERGSPLPGAAVGISPATDLTASGPSRSSRARLDPMFGGRPLQHIGKWYAGETDLSHPLISPLFADLHGLPPILLHAGDHEILLDDSTRLAEKARAQGVDANAVVWPEMFHVFHLFWPILPEARRANREIADFIRLHQGNDRTEGAS